MYQDNTQYFGENYPVEQPKMKNADMPAMPTSPNSNDPEWAAARTGGLTKREMFAMSAMQGMLSHPDVMYTIAHAVAANAVLMADALISKLEQPK